MSVERTPAETVGPNGLSVTALGLRHVDTSPAYGQSERRPGIALRRNEFPGLTISTKVGTHPSRKLSYAAEDIRWSLENSLSLLSRDSVDLALIHEAATPLPAGVWKDALVRIAELDGRQAAAPAGRRTRDAQRW